jgi:hypothetical protein
MLEQNMARSFLAPAIITALWLTACAAQQGGDGYRVVHADITYGPHDKRDREWRALMTALDRCHDGGFSDAQPVAPPQTRCLDNGPDGCRRFAASMNWDCVGMGYQPN